LLSAPKEKRGVPEGWFDGLDRVEKGRLGEKVCPICAERFRDGKFCFLGRLWGIVVAVEERDEERRPP
jgi:hypothetical protein